MDNLSVLILTARCGKYLAKAKGYIQNDNGSEDLSMTYEYFTVLCEFPHLSDQFCINDGYHEKFCQKPHKRRISVSSYNR